MKPANRRIMRYKQAAGYGRLIKPRLKSRLGRLRKNGRFAHCSRTFHFFIWNRKTPVEHNIKKLPITLQATTGQEYPLNRRLASAFRLCAVTDRPLAIVIQLLILCT